jgi:serine/threonine protein kinase
MASDPTRLAGSSRAHIPARLVPGARFGRYEIIERLGFGGMAEVYRARDPTLERFVALKVILPQLAADPEFGLRFASEARLAARLNHPNVVTVYEIDEVDGQQYLAMQFVPGPTLAAILARSGALAPTSALSILQQIGDALDHAHAAGVIHRDLKPANILINTEQSRALLADFGIARAADAGTRLTRTGGTMGTASYMAPEQVTDDGPVGPAVDRYALGVVAYELLCGRVPFTAARPTGVMFKHAYEPVPPIREFNPRLSEGVEAVLVRMLAKKPEERYPTAAAFVADLRGPIGELPTETQGATLLAATSPAAATSPPTVPPPVTAEPPTPQVKPKGSHKNLILILALAFGFSVITLGVLGVALSGQETDVQDVQDLQNAAQVATPVSTQVTQATQAIQASSQSDVLAAVTPPLRAYYQQHGVEPRTLRTRVTSLNPAQTAGVVEVMYPASVSQSTNGVDWTIQTNALDAWQLSKDANQQWSLGKQLSARYVGGASTADALAAVQAILKYDQVEETAARTLNANLLAPVSTPAWAREVQAQYADLKQQGYTSMVETLTSATFCRFTQDTPTQISVAVDEVWNHAAYKKSLLVDQQTNGHNPQVERVALSGASWLVDGEQDTQDLPSDFPQACRGPS